MLQTVNLPRHWQKPILGLSLAALVCITVFWKTWGSIVAIWARSDTFAHGYLVVPISLWLIWTRKDQYRDMQASPSPIGLFLILCCGFVWLSAYLVHVLVVQQWAAVSLLIATIWTILGNRVTSKMLFPILFLFLMVPFGEDFVPSLMEYTATFVVGMLRLTGMSVYREGLHFTLTSGNWSVVEACSGIRYLIASITLGLVYAYLNYNSYAKRAYFILAAILTPILANGLRAYLIVMIGHLSSMKLATGVDHIIYGWVFFGIVMLLMFYVGSYWRDPPPPIPEEGIADTDTVYRYPHFWPMMVSIGLCLAVWPVGAAWINLKQSAEYGIPKYFTQPPISQWQPVNPPNWGWEPRFPGVGGQAISYLTNGETLAGIYVAHFSNDTRDGELINSQNVLIAQNEKSWRLLTAAKTSIHWPGRKPADIDESVLVGSQRSILALRWYRIGSENTANTYYAKWLQLLKRLSGDSSPELMIVIFTETPRGEYEPALSRLRQFAEACCG